MLKPTDNHHVHGTTQLFVSNSALNDVLGMFLFTVKECKYNFDSAEKYGYVGLGLSIAAITFGFIELITLLLPTVIFCSFARNTCT